MSDSRGSSEITRSSPQHQQTETSPLKQNETKKNWLSSFLLSSENDNDQGSLKMIVLIFFAFTVVVTLGLLAQIYYGGYQIQPHGSIATDSQECSEIGINILKKGGNAVDAAIASTFCLGVVNFHITGLGGGGYMLIYNHMKQKVIDMIDFQVTVPNSLVNKHLDTSIDGLTVGVPGFLMGMWVAHQKYGKLSWAELVMPAAELARNGFLVTKNVIEVRAYLNNNSKYNKNLVQFLSALKEGKNAFPNLADTLELVATFGPNAMYNGSLGEDIIHTVQKGGGSLSSNDLLQYHVIYNDTIQTRFGNFNILTPASSSGGALLLNALDMIQFLDLTPEDDISSVILRLSDVLHDTYVSFLKKNDANPSVSEAVASHISAVDVDEIYVSVVSGLNTWLGSQLMTESGFILNNAIVNGGVNNERRPISLSTPVIALENGEICGKRFVLGSGDATIAAQVLTNALVLNNDVNSSIEFPRFFVSNVPRLISVEDLHEPFYSSGTIKKLRSLLKFDRIIPPYKSINVIEKEGDNVEAHSDSRGGGVASKF